MVVGGEWGQVNALGAGGFYEKGFRFRGVQLHEKMYAGFFTGDSNILGQAAILYSGQKGITFGVIIISQPVDMFLEVSFSDKTGQCLLFEIGHCAGIKGEFFIKFLQKLSGKYHVADADGGGEGFGKGVHIDYFIGYIDALQSRDRLPA